MKQNVFLFVNDISHLDHASRYVWICIKWVLVDRILVMFATLHQKNALTFKAFKKFTIDHEWYTLIISPISFLHMGQPSLLFSSDFAHSLQVTMWWQGFKTQSRILSIQIAQSRSFSVIETKNKKKKHKVISCSNTHPAFNKILTQRMEIQPASSSCAGATLPRWARVGIELSKK